jgi:hypothetical protein
MKRGGPNVRTERRFDLRICRSGVKPIEKEWMGRLEREMRKPGIGDGDDGDAVGDQFFLTWDTTRWEA